LKINAPPAKRTELFELVKVFRGSVVDVGPREMIAQMVGPESKIQAFIDVVKPYGLKEMVRSGRIAIKRSESNSG